jgi:hypothetical protein
MEKSEKNLVGKPSRIEKRFQTTVRQCGTIPVTIEAVTTAKKTSQEYIHNLIDKLLETLHSGPTCNFCYIGTGDVYIFAHRAEEGVHIWVFQEKMFGFIDGLPDIGCGGTLASACCQKSEEQEDSFAIIAEDI